MTQRLSPPRDFSLSSGDSSSLPWPWLQKGGGRGGRERRKRDFHKIELHEVTTAARQLPFLSLLTSRKILSTKLAVGPWTSHMPPSGPLIPRHGVLWLVQLCFRESPRGWPSEQYKVPRSLAPGFLGCVTSGKSPKPSGFLMLLQKEDGHSPQAESGGSPRRWGVQGTPLILGTQRAPPGHAMVSAPAEQGRGRAGRRGVELR